MKKNSPFFIGLALFAMFFGSGNLTFPLVIGQFSKNIWPIAIIGFFVSAVLLPFTGALAMINSKCNTKIFFNSFGKYLGGKYLIPILLTVWIPLGSAPRCITVAHASIASYIPMPLWAFSLGFCLLVFTLIYKKNNLLTIIGYFLTPLLLLSLLLLLIAGILTPATMQKTLDPKNIILAKSLMEGYNTMDLIAACFFASSIAKLINIDSNKNPIKIVFKASVYGMILLGIVYFGLIYLAAKYSHVLQGVEKQAMLPVLAIALLGPKMAIISCFVIILACVTTLAALVHVYAEYLQTLKPKILSKKHSSSIITLILTFGLSLIGFSGITSISSPMLQVLYPVVIFIVLVSFSKNKKLETQTN